MRKKRKPKRLGSKKRGSKIENPKIDLHASKIKTKLCGKANLEVWVVLSSSYPVSRTQETNGTWRTILPVLLPHPKGFQRISKTSVPSNKNSLQPHHLQKIQDTTIKLRLNKEEQILTWVQNELRPRTAGPMEWSPT